MVFNKLLFIVSKISFLAVPLLIENTKLRFAFVILTGAPITVAHEAIESPPLGADKSKKAYQENQTLHYIY